MGVYIKGMKMPKHDDEYVIFTVYGDGGVVYGPLNRPQVRYKHRAVTVPEPHGRLGDLDKLADNMRSATAGMEHRAIIMHEVRRAPTIIEAEEV